MKKILKITLVILVMLIASPVQSQGKFKKKKKAKKSEIVNPEGKIWEQPTSRTPFIYKEGKYTSRITKSGLRNLPKDFIAEVNNRNNQGIPSNDIFITYRGHCAKQILLRPRFVYLGDKTTSLDIYRASNNSSDLPIHELLKPLLKGLLDQCDELESIRIEMITYQERIANGVQKIYRGTMNKSNDWKLEDGFQEANSDYVFKLNTGPKDLFTLLGIYYEGKCNNTATMHIAPIFLNDTQKTFYKKKASFINFSNVAKIAINRYKEECINVKTLNFTLDYVPYGYICKEGTDCTLTAKKSTNWEIDSSNFEFIPYVEPLMTNFKDVIELLDKGDFESFKDYTPFFKLFFEEYSGLYGDYCNSNLINPTPVVTQRFKQKTYSDGSKTEELLYTFEVFIETKYLSRYKMFKSQNNLTMVKDVFKLAVQINKQKSLSPIQNELSYMLSNRRYIVQHLNGKCNSPKVRNVYAKMQELGATLYSD